MRLDDLPDDRRPHVTSERCFLSPMIVAQREKVSFYIIEIHSGLLHIVSRSARLTIWSSPEGISRTEKGTFSRCVVNTQFNYLFPSQSHLEHGSNRCLCLYVLYSTNIAGASGLPRASTFFPLTPPSSENHQDNGDATTGLKRVRQ